MTVKHEYQRVARRSIMASESLLSDKIQEKAAFFAYHAFESTGCALTDHMGLYVGPRVSHARKLNNFKQAANRLGKGRSVAALTVTLNSIRNSFLYPIINSSTGSVQMPENVITLADSKQLKKRVKGIIDWVDKQL